MRYFYLFPQIYFQFLFLNAQLLLDRATFASEPILSDVQVKNCRVAAQKQGTKYLNMILSSKTIQTFSITKFF